MVRDLKFRAWVESEKRYADGCTVYHDGSSSATIQGYSEMLKCEVDYDGYDCIVEQWTGVKDSGGALIYEGDVVDFCLEEKLCKVVFKDGGFFLEANNGDGYGLPYYKKYGMKVVGNIHEGEK